MSREIKFRIWSAGTNAGEMIYLDRLNLTGDSVGWADDENGNEYEFSDKCPLMQFTGLYDKNGKPIFESDIVKFINSTIDSTKDVERIGVVEYDISNIGGCRFMPISKEERAFEDEMGVRFSWSELEVLGNIYEHPRIPSTSHPFKKEYPS